MKFKKFKFLRFLAQIRNLLDLKTDFDEQGTYTLINSGAEFKSGNAWGLIFAIFIASIGLNVNSTAVIIGAMLISPLMGPIVGSGFSLGTHDFDLLKKSIKNLIYAVAISVVTSTLFFLISPSGGIKSELLARTQPTIFDVLIAFFGGAAGIVASTRMNKGNAVPGVAIATALMPPLCTVGYSIAHFEFKYAVGAFYLFSINTVFILIATYVFTRILGFKLKIDRNFSRDKVIHRYMTWGSFVFIIPSIVMAWYLHKKSQFESSAQEFINSQFNFSTTIVAKKDITFDLKTPQIEVFILGDDLNEDKRLKISQNLLKMPALRNSNLIIRAIQNDNFSINDLEERFVRKNEFAQLFKIEEANKISLQAFKTSEILNDLNKILENQIHDLEIVDNKIKLHWKIKPSKSRMNSAEIQILKLLLDKKMVFSHSVVVR